MDFTVWLVGFCALATLGLLVEYVIHYLYLRKQNKKADFAWPVVSVIALAATVMVIGLLSII